MSDSWEYVVRVVFDLIKAQNPGSENYDSGFSGEILSELKEEVLHSVETQFQTLAQDLKLSITCSTSTILNTPVTQIAQLDSSANW